MIIKQSDLDELEKYLEDFRKYETDPSFWWSNGESSVDFFADRPHLILPVGFDQTRPLFSPDFAKYLREEGEDADWVEEILDEASSVREDYGIKSLTFDFEIEYLYRNLGSGSWSWFLGLEDDQLIFRGPKSQKDKAYSIEFLFKKLKDLVAVPDQTTRTLWLPQFWTVDFQNKTRLELSKNVSEILEAIISEKKELNQITPRTLEEIVAELLRSKGMDIYLTPQTRDGGRDIVARGEVFPGEPLTFAIEVKQKPVVGIGDIDRALKANEDFPAVMLATSGRFSAGVIREQQRNRNQLRLILKDGIALSQWIDSYWYSNKKI